MKDELFNSLGTKNKLIKVQEWKIKLLVKLENKIVNYENSCKVWHRPCQLWQSN